MSTAKHIDPASFRNRLIALLPMLVCLGWHNALVGQAVPSQLRVLATDSLPLAGVTVSWQQDGEGNPRVYYAVTDVRGKATLPLTTRAHVQLTYIGFESQRVTVLPGDDKTVYLVRIINPIESVVVTGQLDATRPQQSAENVKVIDRKRIEQSQARNVRDLLQQQPELRIAEDNMLGTTVSMHGLTGNNVKIMVDGVPVVGRENGNIDLAQLTLNNVEQIEIVEGPMSVLYSTDAVAGVVNLITRRSTGGKSLLQLNANAETPRSLYLDGTGWLQLKKSHLALSGGRHYFDGFPRFDATRVQQWKPSIKHFANAAYGWKTDRSNTEIKADYFTQTTLDRGKPVATPYDAYAFDRYYNTERLGASAFFNYDITRRLRLDHTAAFSLYAREKETHRKNLSTLESEKLNGEGTATRTEVNHWMYRVLLQQPRINARIRFQTGFEVQYESGIGDKILPGTDPIVEYAVLGQLEYQPVARLHLKPGLRVNYNTVYDAPVIPSLNVRWQVSDFVQLRAGGARGYRAPSMKELYLSFVDLNHDIHGNPDLKSETSWNGTASMQLSRRFDHLAVTLDYSVFYHDIRDQIVLAGSDSSLLYYVYTNVNRTQTMGTDFKAGFAFQDVHVRAGMGFIGVDNGLGVRTAWSPEFNMAFTWQLEKPGLSFNVLYRNIGASPYYVTDDAGLVTRFLAEGYTLMDVLASKSILKNRIVLNAGIKNVLDVTNVVTPATGSAHMASGAMAVARGRYITTGLSLNLYKDHKPSTTSNDP